jgi:hypothetical protein
VVAVVGYLVAAVIAVAILLLITQRGQVVARNLDFSVGDIGARHVAITSGLAGFAVTTLVLIVTLGRNLADTSGSGYTSLLTLIVVAYFGFFASSIMFAGISESDRTPGFDVPAAMLIGASVTLAFSALMGWLALIPLFATFGLTRMVDIAGWLVVAAAIGAYWSLSTDLHRSGLFTLGQIVLIPLLAVVATIA